MKRLGWVSLVMGLLGTLAYAADELKMPVNLDKLAARATETVDVTLDSSMLQFASKFLSSDDPDNAKVKRIVTKLKSVYVRSFEFSKEGEYSPGDVESLREQLKSPAWMRIVGVRSNKGENSDIFVKRDGEKVVGLVVIALEPKELTIVHIDGNISLDELSELGGNMGIPKIDAKKGRIDQPKGKEE